MVDATKTRNQIRDILDEYGSTVSIINVSESTDKWGDETETVDDTNSVKGIPYQYFPERLRFIPTGNLEDADQVMIIKDNVTVSLGDVAVYKTIGYDVHAIEKYMLAGTLLALMLILNKRDKVTPS